MAYAPQIKGLKVYQKLEEAWKYIGIDLFVPELNGNNLPNRDYFINVCKIVTKLKSLIINTFVSECLQKIDDIALEDREEKYTEKRNIKMNG